MSVVTEGVMARRVVEQRVAAHRVVAQRVVAPHGWLRYDVERIRSVRHLTDPKYRPGGSRGVWNYARRYLGLRLNGALSCTN
jgi:hypothetical protein